MPRLGVTRPKAQLAELIQNAAERGIEIIPLPVIATKNIPFLFPPECELKSIDWLVFSSAVGVDAFFTRLEEVGLTLPITIQISAVGEKTAEAVKSRGLVVAHLPSEAYGQILFEELATSVIKKGQTVLYARAGDVNFDPADLFALNEITYFGIVCYETVSQKISSDLNERLKSDDYILFTAPSTVRSYHEQFGRPTARAIAIGNSTGSEMWKLGWVGFSWLTKPDINLVLEYI